VNGVSSVDEEPAWQLVAGADALQSLLGWLDERGVSELHLRQQLDKLMGTIHSHEIAHRSWLKTRAAVLAGVPSPDAAQKVSRRGC